MHKRLIIRPGAIGDTILALPAMEHLRSAFTEVWVTGHNVPLIRFADRVRSIASAGLDLVGIPDREPPPVMEELQRFDSIVSWYGTNRAEFREAVAGLPFTFLTALPEAGGTHAADFFARQVGAAEPAVPRLPCKPDRRSSGCAVIQPFSGGDRKNWPLKRFRDAAARLPVPVQWCAGPEEALEGALRIADLYELARLLAGAALYVGNDSGITHLAAAAGAPVIALFGPTDPGIWAPRGERVRVVVSETGAMEGIEVETVVGAALGMLG